MTYSEHVDVNLAYKLLRLEALKRLNNQVIAKLFTTNRLNGHLMTFLNIQKIDEYFRVPVDVRVRCII